MLADVAGNRNTPRTVGWAIQTEDVYPGMVKHHGMQHFRDHYHSEIIIRSQVGSSVMVHLAHSRVKTMPLFVDCTQIPFFTCPKAARGSAPAI